MSVTIGEINGRVFVELDTLADYLSADDVHRAVVQTLNVRTEFTRSADTNRLLATTSEFTPTTLAHNITAEIGLGSPAWIECKNSADDRFYPIRVVSLVELEEYTKRGILAAAFWGDDTGHGSAAADQYVQFSFLPPSVCRIRYDRDLVRIGTSGNSLLPDHVADLISKEAQVSLIGRAKLKLAQDLRRDEATRQDAKLILAMVDDYRATLVNIEIPKLERLWEIWAFRAVNVPFNNPTPSGRGQYGDTTFDRF